MPGRVQQDQRLTRAILALVIAVVATTFSVYLLATDARHKLEPAVAVSQDMDTEAASSETSLAGLPETVQPGPPTEAIHPAPEPVEIRTIVDRTMPMRDYLEAAGLKADEADRWARLFASEGRSRLLRRGHNLTLYKDPETGELRGLKYDIDDRVAVRERWLGGGVVLATREFITYVVRSVQCAFKIKRNFSADAAIHKIPKPVIDRLVDAFGSRERTKEPKPGAAVKIIYNEKVSRDGVHRILGDVEAAQLQDGAAKLTAYGFRDERGHHHLYDEQGRPLEVQFLRFPLPFKYISSGFTAARYHPILHRYRPHVGVDLVASYGTPVKAVSDGMVESAGWNGELGECVKISHEQGLSTVYAHLSRISAAVRPGASVRMGQVIGSVGSTGLSTGPHLHFAIFKNGSYVNPLTVKLEQSHEIVPRMRAFFREVKRRCQLDLNGMPNRGDREIASSDRKPAISELGDQYHVKLNKPYHRNERHERRIYQTSAKTEAPVRRAALTADEWSDGFDAGGL